MFEDYRNRIARRNGSYMGETMRKQTGLIVDATWFNSIYTKPVCVQHMTTGLPKSYESADDFEETLWAHFKPNKTYSVGGNATDNYLVFMPHTVAEHPEIKVGAYVSLPNVHNDVETWLIVNMVEDNDLIKANILKTNWILRWVTDGKIYNSLGVLRSSSALSSGIEENGLLTTVDGDLNVWIPTSYDSRTIGVNTRFLISDEGRTPPQAWSVSRITDTLPIGLTKLGLEQDQYTYQTDNVELMIANYYSSGIAPEEPDQPEVDDGDSSFGGEPTMGTATITYTGTKPTIKVGGSFKTFTAAFSSDGVTAKSWSVYDGTSDFAESVGDYTVEYTDTNNLRLKVAENYYLIGTVLTVSVVGSDGSTAEVQIEII